MKVYFRHCVYQISKIIFSLGRDTSRVPSIKQEIHLYWGWSYLHLSFIEYKFIFIINQLVNLIDTNWHSIKSHDFFQIVSFNNTNTYICGYQFPIKLWSLPRLFCTSLSIFHLTWLYNMLGLVVIVGSKT